jgi:heavy metal translocating P-type ATPase
VDGLEDKQTCILCGTPLGNARERSGQFCCAGCAHVYQVLKNLSGSAGKAYVEASRKLGVIPENVSGEAEKSEEDFPFPPSESAMRDQPIVCEGLTCPSCAWVLEQVLLSNPGVDKVEVSYFTESGRLRYDLRRVSIDELNSLLRPLGHRIDAFRDQAKTRLRGRSTLAFLIAAVLTMNIMTLSFLRYFEHLGYLDSAPEFLSWLEMLLTWPVLYIGWFPMVRRAIAGLKERRMTMDLLISLAVGAAFLLSLAALLTGRDDIYFETCAGLVTISLLSQMIEARLRERAYGDLAGLLKMRVKNVRTTEAGETDSADATYRPVSDINHGDRVAFLPSETVPFDGIVAGEAVLVSEAVLTGEPTPVQKVNGDTVSAGSTVVEGRLEMKTVRRYDETRLFQITQSLAAALQKAENRWRSADRISNWFVPAVLVVAIGAWLARLGLFGFSYAVSTDGWFPSVAVLAIACPCAFSLAGIAAITAATGSLLKQGFLVKEPDQLEALRRIRHMVFDKTGTVTEGMMKVEKLVWRGAEDNAMMSLIRTAEERSTHPVATAIRTYLQSHETLEEKAPDVSPEDLPGRGRVARFDGREFSIGSASLFEDPFVPSEMTPRHTAVWYGFGRRAAGCFLLTDRPRANAREAISGLKELDLSCELLSGDRDAVTKLVASELGMSRATGDVSLDEKVSIVKEIETSGRATAFVGDGTNDALAMSEATVSIALGSSSDEALTACGFVSLNSDLGCLKELFKLGNKLSQVIRTNYIWAFAFNAVFIPVAALGKLVPLVAMLLMLVSSTAVLLNSLRLKKGNGPTRITTADRRVLD